MAANLNETASITLTIEGSKARNELALLEGEARKLEKALKETVRGSEDWADLNKQINNNTDAQKALRDQIGLTGLTMKQLQSESKALTKEISNLTPGTEEFIAKSARLQEINKRYADLRTEATGVSKVLGQNTTSFERVTASVADWDDKSKRATLTVKQLREIAQQLDKQIDELVPGTKAHADALVKQNDVTKQLNTTLEKQPNLWAKIKTTALGVFTGQALWEGAKALGDFIIGLGKDIFETTSKFEKYETILTTALGSQEAARQAMSEIQQVAAKTPFSVDELTESYLKYVNRGIKPSMAEMTKMADVAASQGKSFDQLTEAVLDAATGEFERLKEFGIAAKKSGDQVELSFKGVTKSVANTPEAIQGALVSFGELKGVMGMTATMSGTLEGKTSNLGDTFDMIKVAIGDRLKPVFVNILDTGAKLLDWVQDAINNVDVLDGVFETITGTARDWMSVFTTIIKSIFPNFSTEGVTVRNVMQWIAVAIQTMLIPARLTIATLVSMLSAFQGVVSGAKAFGLALTGDFAGAGKALDVMKQHGVNIKTTFESAFNDIAGGYKKAFVDAPKKTAPEVINTAKDTAKKTGEAVSEETKKAREKEAKAVQKDTEETNKKKREAQIAAIQDETQRELAKLQWKRDQEVAAIQKSKISEKEKNEAIAAQDKLLKAEQERVNKEHLAKVKADQQKALELERSMRLEFETDARKRAELDAQFKYEKEKERIEAEVKDEVQKKTLLELAQANYNRAVEKLNTDFRSKERESNNFIRQQEQAAQTAQFDWQEKTAGSNASKLREIKRARLAAELQNELANLAAEKAAEEARIAESNLSQDQKAAQQRSINDRYLAEVTAANRGFDADMKALDEQHLQQKRERWINYSNAFKSLLSGDLNGFVSTLQHMAQVDAEHQNQKLRRASETADQVGEIAKAGVAFLNKLTQERLDKEIATSKKETETKLADNQTRMKAAIKAAEEQAEKEKAAAGDSAEAQQAIEEKLATNKASIREQFEDEADSIRQEATAKEKALAMKKWEADKKAQIATALISGAQAALKALASGIFPVNLIFAGVTAGLTAIQIAKIKNQPAPSFRDGGAFTLEGGGIRQMFARGGRGFVRNAGVLQGARHGSRYGQKGIAMIDRESGREVGEAEGGEPFMILSRNTYANNRPIIDRLLYSSMYRGGQKIAYRDGGVGGSWQGVGTIAETPYYSRDMYLFGSKKAKREAAAAQAEAEEAARKAQEEASAMAASYSAYDGPTSYNEGDANGQAQASGYSAAAEQQAQQAAKMAQNQLDLLKDIGEAIETMSSDVQLALEKLAISTDLALARLDEHTQAGLNDLITVTQETSVALATSNKTALDGLSANLKTSIDGMAQQVGELKSSIHGVENAVHGVEGAVNGVQGAIWGTNQAGRLDALIATISSLK